MDKCQINILIHEESDQRSIGGDPVQATKATISLSRNPDCGLSQSGFFI